MAAAPKEPFIRRYDPSDKANAVRAFRGTADESVQREPLSTIGSHIWCLPYVALSPKTCFVVDDGSGKAVGYCIGTPDTADFARRWPAEFVPTIEMDLRRLEVEEGVGEEEAQKMRARQRELCEGIYEDPESLVYGKFKEQLKDYPGHLHIDILPSHQRMGFGKQLIEALLASFREAGCKGLYLGMVAGNDGAARFYERLGFYRLPSVLDGGVSGEQGRTKGEGGSGGTIYYVKDL